MSPLTPGTRRALRPIVLAGALGATAMIPLAATSSSSAGAVIGGSTRIGDRVSVSFKQATPPGGAVVAAHILGFNDFHGQLESGPAIRRFNQYAGGAAYLSKAIKDKQNTYGLTNQATVFAGDSIGATPLVSAGFDDEPAIMALNQMRIDFGAVGNHEFDLGTTELLRKQNGCAGQPASCSIAKTKGAGDYLLPGGSTTPVYPGANFQYLAANVINNATSAPLLPAYGIKIVNGQKIGFIGETLTATPTIVTPAGVAGLTFLPEIAAANAAATALKAQGANTIVLVLHQGGFQSSAAAAPSNCAGNLVGSEVATIAAGLDPDIGLIVSGHTHAEYMCTITTGAVTRIIGSASNQGTILSDYTLNIDSSDGKLVSASGVNTIVLSSSVAPNSTNTNYVQDPSKQDADTQAVVAQYAGAIAPVANVVVGRVTADILNSTVNPFREMTAGDLVADAMLAATSSAATGGAQVAFMNSGGVRAPGLTFAQSSALEGNGVVTYGEAFTMQPFSNSLVVKTLTGTQLRSVLEQQYVGCGGQTTQRIMLPSNGFRYETDPAAATCAGKIGTIQINGNDVAPGDSVRVTMNSFMATGGDGYTVFNSGTNQLGGVTDIQALIAYLAPSITGTPFAPITLKTTAPVLAADANRIVSLGSLTSNVVPEGQPLYFVMILGGGVFLALAAMRISRQRAALLS
jgi:5'-nucleotidase